MSMKLVRKVLKPVMDWVSEVQVVRYPLWLITGPTHNDVEAKQIRRVLAVARHGDIVFRRQGKAVGTKIIPGYFSHVGVMKNKDTVIHAVGAGVKEEDILDFLRTDACAVLRVPNEALRRKAVKRVQECVGKPYDYIFDSDDKRALYCVELGMYGYPDVIPGRTQERDAVSPDEFYDIVLEKAGGEKLYDTRD